MIANEITSACQGGTIIPPHQAITLYRWRSACPAVCAPRATHTWPGLGSCAGHSLAAGSLADAAPAVGRAGWGTAPGPVWASGPGGGGSGASPTGPLPASSALGGGRAGLCRAWRRQGSYPGGGPGVLGAPAPALPAQGAFLGAAGTPTGGAGQSPRRAFRDFPAHPVLPLRLRPSQSGVLAGRGQSKGSPVPAGVLKKKKKKAVLPFACEPDSRKFPSGAGPAEPSIYLSFVVSLRPRAPASAGGSGSPACLTRRRPKGAFLSKCLGGSRNPV